MTPFFSLSMRLPSGVLLAFGFLFFGGVTPIEAATPAHSVLIVEQKGPSGALGTWMASTPSGARRIEGRSDEPVTRIDPADTGTYSVTVEPPLGAHTAIRIYRESQLMKTAAGTQTTFTIPPAETITVEIRYSYNGTITVESAPRGVSFRLTAPYGMDFTGETPASFRNMPPLYYTVNYGRLPGCLTQTPMQSRDLHTDGTLRFYAVYSCERPSTPSTMDVGQKMPPMKVTTLPPAVRIVQTPTRGEILPGDTVKFTVALRNMSSTTLKNLTLTDQFNPARLRIMLPLKDGGAHGGNTLRWRIPILEPGDLWTTSFGARVADDTASGERITLLARVEGEGLDPSIVSNTHIATLGIALMPETGKATTQMIILVGSLIACLLLTLLNRRRIVSTP